MSLTVRPVTVTGGSPTYDNATYPAGDTIPGSVVATGRCFVRAQNPTAASITITVTDPGTTPGGQANPDPTYVVPAAVGGAPGEQEFAVPQALVDPSTGSVAMSYSATGLKIALRTV